MRSPLGGPDPELCGRLHTGHDAGALPADRLGVLLAGLRHHLHVLYGGTGGGGGAGGMSSVVDSHTDGIFDVLRASLTGKKEYRQEEIASLIMMVYTIFSFMICQAHNTKIINTRRERG